MSSDLFLWTKFDRFNSMSAVAHRLTFVLILMDSLTILLALECRLSCLPSLKHILSFLPALVLMSKLRFVAALSVDLIY